MAEHWARYRFAVPGIRGRVLDVACGTGYGAHEAARSPAVREVIGIDRSDDALAWARRYYPSPKVRYRRIDLEQAGWEVDLGRFDSILAFEILEHLREDRHLMDGIFRALRPGGTAWVSTPLGRGRGWATQDPFHVHQLLRSEFASLFDPRQIELRLYGQLHEWIEPWVAGRRYATILARARRTKEEIGR